MGQKVIAIVILMSLNKSFSSATGCVMNCLACLVFGMKCNINNIKTCLLINSWVKDCYWALGISSCWYRRVMLQSLWLCRVHEPILKKDA